MDQSRKTVVIVGGLSSDNTTAANTLLDEEIYPENYRLRTCEQKQGFVKGTSVNLLVTPGILDQGKSKESNRMIGNIKQEVRNSVSCMVIVTAVYPLRWTDEFRFIRNALINIIGEENMSQKGIFLVTNAKAFENKAGGNMDDYFARYISDQASNTGREDGMASLLKYFKSNKHFYLDCLLGDESINNPQLEKLSEILRSSRNTENKGGEPVTHSYYGGITSHNRQTDSQSVVSWSDIFCCCRNNSHSNYQ